VKNNSQRPRKTSVEGGRDASVGGDAVGGDKVTTNINIYQQLDQQPRQDRVPAGQNVLEELAAKEQLKQAQRTAPVKRATARGVAIVGGVVLVLIAAFTFYRLLNPLAGAAGAASVSPTEAALASATATPAADQGQSDDVVFELGAESCGATVAVATSSGAAVLTVYVAPGTSQTVRLPPGDYIYTITYDCVVNLAGAAGAVTPVELAVRPGEAPRIALPEAKGWSLPPQAVPVLIGAAELLVLAILAAGLVSIVRGAHGPSDPDSPSSD
jgi:hypothetical protein